MMLIYGLENGLKKTNQIFSVIKTVKWLFK